jgi:16S rRNA (cytosine967-C5)-methyltransferase
MRKIELKTKVILRMGILQLLFMDKVPESAAVNESVILAKKHKLQKSSGFINGILRNIVRAEIKYVLPDKSDKVRYYAVKYSVPQEVVKLWLVISENAISVKVTSTATSSVITAITLPALAITAVRLCFRNPKGSSN